MLLAILFMATALSAMEAFIILPRLSHNSYASDATAYVAKQKVYNIDLGFTVIAGYIDGRFYIVPKYAWYITLEAHILSFSESKRIINKRLRLKYKKYSAMDYPLQYFVDFPKAFLDDYRFEFGAQYYF